MSNKKVYAFGEVLFDEYRGVKKLGGAPFNYTCHLNKLFRETFLISAVGNDEDGQSILSYMKGNSVPTDYIQIDEKHKTGLVKVELSADKVPDYKILRNRAYDNINIDINVSANIENTASLFYFGTLAQRSTVSRNTLNNLFGKDVKYLFDVNLRQNFYTKEILTNSFHTANVVKMNIDELRIINVLFYNGDTPDLNKTALSLISDYNLDLLSITLGGEGAVLINKNDKHFHKEPAEKLVSTVGAGDAYSAILTIGYLSGWDLERINKSATKFASGICGIDGAIPEDDKFYFKFKKMIKDG